MQNALFPCDRYISEFPVLTWQGPSTGISTQEHAFAQVVLFSRSGDSMYNLHNNFINDLREKLKKKEKRNVSDTLVWLRKKRLSVDLGYRYDAVFISAWLSYKLSQTNSDLVIWQKISALIMTTTSKAFTEGVARIPFPTFFFFFCVIFCCQLEPWAYRSTWGPCSGPPGTLVDQAKFSQITEEP